MDSLDRLNATKSGHMEAARIFCMHRMTYFYHVTRMKVVQLILNIMAEIGDENNLKIEVY